jgi:signal transduction histidine kinase
MQKRLKKPLSDCCFNKVNRMLKKPSGIYFFCLLTLFLFISSCGFHQNRKNQPTAIRGVIDLTGWDFQNDGPVDLNGEYRFFWNHLVDAHEVDRLVIEASPAYIPVPSDWNGFEANGTRTTGHGYGTYHLKINLASQNTPLALKILDMGTAVDLIVNGRKLYSAGVFSTARGNSQPEYRPEIIELPEADETLDLIFQVSNYSHRRGGIWEKLVLGTAAQMKSREKKNIGYDAFLLGSILIMALYHMGIYILRRESKSTVFFSIFCMLIALRLLTTGDKLILQISPWTSWDILIRLEYFSFYLAVPVFTQFIYAIFPHYFSKKTMQAITAVGTLFAAQLLIFPTTIFTHTLPVFQFFTLSAFIYPFFILTRASLKKDTEAMVFFGGFIILFSSVLNDILYAENIIHTGDMVPKGLFLFILSQAFLISLHYSKSFDTIENQQAILTETNLAYKNEIRDRKQAEQALQESHKRFILVLNSIEANVFVMDMVTYEILFMNQRMQDVFGDDYTGRKCSDVFQNKSGPCKQCTHIDLLDNNGQPKGLKIWESQNSLNNRWYINYDRAIIWDGSRVVRLQVSTDVTERKLAEEKLKMVNEDLEIRVQERTTDILQANEALRSEIEERKAAQEVARKAKINAEIANRSKSEFLANMSHELRTPLNHIIGFTELLLDKSFGKLNNTQEEYLDDVYMSSKHLLALINDILDLSKVESGKLELQLSEFHLKDLISSSLVMLKEKAMQHSLQFALDIDGIPDSIQADERKVKQILYNLLSNAVKFTPDGGKVSVNAVTLPENSITGPLKGGRMDKSVIITVSDTGIGIHSKDLEMIFNPFEQVESTTTKRFQGTGLGLSLTKKLVELHGGTIWAESNGAGNGSSFHFTVPLQRE